MALQNITLFIIWKYSNCIEVEYNVMLFSTKHKMFYIYIIPSYIAYIPKVNWHPSWPIQHSHLININSSHQEEADQIRKDKCSMPTNIYRMFLRAACTSTHFPVVRIFLQSYTWQRGLKNVSLAAKYKMV